MPDCFETVVDAVRPAHNEAWLRHIIRRALALIEDGDVAKARAILRLPLNMESDR